MDRSQKPCDVESARELRQSGTPGHQDQPAVPYFEKFGPRHQGGPGRMRRLDQNLVLGGLGNHHEGAVSQRRDSGQGSLGKPCPVGTASPGLEPEILGAPEHFRCANLFRSKAVADLFAVSRNALEVQQRHEGFEARIRWSCGIDFSAHCASPGNFAFTRAAVPAMAAGSTADRQSASHLGHCPP